MVSLVDVGPGVTAAHQRRGDGGKLLRGGNRLALPPRPSQQPRVGRILVGPLVVAVLGEGLDLRRIGLAHDLLEEHRHGGIDQVRIRVAGVPAANLLGVVERDQLEVRAVLAQQRVVGPVAAQSRDERLDLALAAVAEVVAGVAAVINGADEHFALAIRALPVEHRLRRSGLEALADAVVAVKEVRHPGLGAIGRQRPGQADHIVNLGRLAWRHPKQIGRMPARQVKEPRHQFIAHLLGAGRVVHGADLYPALANAPSQLRRVGLAVAAEEARDGFAGLDDVTELAVLVPAIGFRAELEWPLDVGVADVRAQPVGIIAEPQVMVRVGDAVNLPLLLRLPGEFVPGQHAVPGLWE